MQRQRIVLGIDPGLDGAIAVLAEGGDFIQVVDMPTIEARKRRAIDEIELARLIDNINQQGHVVAACVEIVGPHKGEGPAGAFTFGRGYGVIRGILRANFIPILDCQPQKWRRLAGIPSGAGKDASRAKAKELYQHQAGLFVRVKDHGRSDAVLIARTGLRLTTSSREEAA